ncbi:MAG: hypothetical protein M3Z54_08655, partial [Gemmatimonadota bacterium]|nr:hypothetical protein [Gemmatimonadota bacterium]
VLSTDHDRKKAQYVSRIRGSKPMPDYWSLMVGDVIHNLRSALDNLTYALAVKAFGGVPSLDEIKKIQFPVCDGPGEFHGPNGQKTRRLSLLSDKATAAIERLQPYTTPTRPKPHPLAVLRELANIDKHRHILFTAAVLRPILVRVNTPSGGQSVFPGSFEGPFEDGTVCCVFPDTGLGPASEMDVDSDIPVDIAFGDLPPVHGTSVRPELVRIRDHIRDIVLPVLEPLLI